MYNNAALVHSANAFGGKPKRFREVAADYEGHISELLAKATSQNKLDDQLSKDEKDGVLEMLKSWGGLDKNYEYKKGLPVSRDTLGSCASADEIARFSTVTVQATVAPSAGAHWSGARCTASSAPRDGTASAI